MHDVFDLKLLSYILSDWTLTNFFFVFRDHIGNSRT